MSSHFIAPVFDWFAAEPSKRKAQRTTPQAADDFRDTEPSILWLDSEVPEPAPAALLAAVPGDLTAALLERR